MMHNFLLWCALLAIGLQGKRVQKQTGESYGKEADPKGHALLPLLLAFNPSQSNAIAFNLGFPRSRVSGAPAPRTGLGPSMIVQDFLGAENLSVEPLDEDKPPIVLAGDDIVNIDAVVAPIGAAVPETRPLTVFENLQARDFQHSEDLQNMRHVLQLYPHFTPQGLEDMNFQSQNRLDHGEPMVTQAPAIHRLAVEAAAQLDMPVPDFFIRQDPRPIAYTFAVKGQQPFIVLTSALLDLMTLEETKAVIGHELGHVKCEHSPWVTMFSMLGLGNDVIGLWFGGRWSPLLEQRLMKWRRAARLSCDRASLLVAQDEQVVVSALEKLAGAALKIDEPPVSSPLGRSMHSQDQSAFFSSQRVREIQKYAEGTGHDATVEPRKIQSEYEDLKARRATTIQFKSG